MPKEETMDSSAVQQIDGCMMVESITCRIFYVDLCVSARCLIQGSSLDTLLVSGSMSGSRCLSQDSSLDTFSVSQSVSGFYPKKILFLFFLHHAKKNDSIYLLTPFISRR